MHHKAYAKVNIFLKIVGTRGAYHELLSRFMRVHALYDELFFAPKVSHEPFELVGNFECPLESNTLYKALMALKQSGFSREVDALMREYALHVNKAIPTGAGLGGGSSDAATFLHMVNQTANLGLTCKELMMCGRDVAVSS